MKNLELIKLIDDYRKHKDKSFDDIYVHYKKLLYFYGGKIGDKDAVHELSAFLAEMLFKINILKFEKDNSDDLHRYIAVCLRNEYYAILKRKQNAKLSFSELTADIPEPHRNIDNSIFIRECLALVSDTQKKILVLRYFYDYSDYEISEKLHISRQAVNKARKKAIDKIRNFYKA